VLRTKVVGFKALHPMVTLKLTLRLIFKVSWRLLHRFYVQIEWSDWLKRVSWWSVCFFLKNFVFISKTMHFLKKMLEPKL